jgi:hypothetical protein
MYSDVFLPLSIMFISTTLSIYKTIDTIEDEIDYHPTTLDKYKYRKILWYFSHFTFSNSIFLLTYFTLKSIDYNINTLFVVIAPISMSININYFLILYPQRNIKLYELPYYSFVQHFMTTIIILNELKYIEYKYFYDIFKYNYFILYGISITFVNYYIRDIWTYGIINLYSHKGWKLILQFNVVSLISSVSLYLIKYNFIN